MRCLPLLFRWGQLLVLAFCLSGLVAPQPAFKFKHLTIDNGLSQNTVYCTLQDRTGYIWVATEEGLNRYDGHEFKTFQADAAVAHSLSNDQVNTLYEDAQGTLWVGTKNGLNRYRADSEDFVSYLVAGSQTTYKTAFITAILQDQHGIMWVGTNDGLKRFDPKRGTFAPVKTAEIPGTTPQSRRIHMLFEDRGHTLWVAVGKDLACLDPVSHQLTSLPAALVAQPNWGQSYVRAVWQDALGNYWIGTEGQGVFRYDPIAKTCRNYHHQKQIAQSLSNNYIRALYEARPGVMWVGTRDGLNILEVSANRFTQYRSDPDIPTSLGHSSIRSIMRDKAGSIWVGTFAGGVDVLEPSYGNFTSIGEKRGGQPGLSSRVVSAVLEDSVSNLWIGTEGGGLNWYDQRTGQFRAFQLKDTSDLGKNNVKSLAFRPDGKLWVGTLHGLQLFNPKTRQFQSYPVAGKPQGLDDQEVTALCATSQGVWVGLNGGGLGFLSEQGRLRMFHNVSGQAATLSADNITALLALPGGQVWVATVRGLNLYDPRTDRFTVYKYEPKQMGSLSNGFLLSLFQDDEGRLWVGTIHGLNLFEPKNQLFYPIDEKYGLANASIRAMQADNAGNLWVSTNKGLARIRFSSRQLPFQRSAVSITNYTVADGLLGNQFSFGSARGRQGRLYFGNIQGLMAFQPEELVQNRFQPAVVLTGLKIRNQPVIPQVLGSPLTKSIGRTQRLTLTHDQAFITLSYAALNFIIPQNNHYAYKLVGLAGDSSWHYVGNQLTATYTNLDPGDYEFRVKAANNDGVWSSQQAHLLLQVLPPWYKTWWAYGLYAGVIGGLLYLFYYNSYKTAQLKNELVFEQLNREKDEQLIQQKISFFTNVSHEIKTPLTLILAPLEKLIGVNEGNNKVQHQLMLMQRNGERLILLINQLLNFRQFESGNMQLQASEGDLVRFTREVLAAFEAFAAHHHIRLSLAAVDDRIQLWFDRDKLEKVLYNLLSNALKFTPDGGQVQVGIWVEPGERIGTAGTVYLEVADTGMGIAPENLGRIFGQFQHFDAAGVNSQGTGIGLAFAKGLVELHHGQISVDSRLATSTAQGYTRFVVRLPLGNQHLTAAEMLSDYTDSEDIRQYTEAENSVGFPLLEARKAEVLRGQDEQKLVMLVVEDNTDLLTFIATHFQDTFEVLRATNGQEGWNKAVAEVPDIIISDVMMPGMSGVELCSRLKQDARTSHIPVILLTARTALTFRIEGLDTGADDYLTKPFSLRYLEARVWNLLHSRQKLRERYKREVTLQPVNVALTSPDELFLEKAMKFIEANLTESNLSVEELGRAVGMSRVTLYRKIKALTNQSAIEFIRNARLNRAAQLISQQKVTINEVAYLVGFTDVDYFRKCFKEHFGKTPTAYAQAGTIETPPEVV